MSAIDILNPSKKLASRLFLWFWVTTVSTALVAMWVGQLLISHVELGTPSGAELKMLNHAIENLEGRPRIVMPIQTLLRDVSMEERHALSAVDLSNRRVVNAGPPMPPEEQEVLVQVAFQQYPITIKRGRITFIGPRTFSVGGREYALFLGKFDGRGPGGPADDLVWIAPIAILLSVVWCYLFASSVVKPIQELQQRSRQLAKGDWDARVDLRHFGKDETGQLAQDFNVMAEKLESMWRGQQRLLADISHELRSPLARLQMALGLAEQQDIDASTLTRIEREAERMEQLIDQLLKLTRTESGQVNFVTMPLSGWLKSIITDANFEASNLNKTVVCHNLPDIDVQVNQDLIRSAVENVIRNAIRYAEKKVEVEVTHRDDLWTVVINDDGPGLPQSECANVFTPFYRPTTSRERESGGAGLGLAIAKAAVDLHHGSINASPRANGGLSVTLCMPVIVTNEMENNA